MANRSSIIANLRTEWCWSEKRTQFVGQTPCTEVISFWENSFWSFSNSGQFARLFPSNFSARTHARTGGRRGSPPSPWQCTSATCLWTTKFKDYLQRLDRSGSKSPVVYIEVLFWVRPGDLSFSLSPAGHDLFATRVQAIPGWMCSEIRYGNRSQYVKSVERERERERERDETNLRLCWAMYDLLDQVRKGIESSYRTSNKGLAWMRDTWIVLGYRLDFMSDKQYYNTRQLIHQLVWR